MKGAFRIAGFVVVLICCCGCSTPEQKEKWSFLFRALANQSQTSYQQYEINQLQRQQAEQSVNNFVNQDKLQHPNGSWNQ